MFVGSVPDPSQWRRSRLNSQVVNGVPQPVVSGASGHSIMVNQAPTRHGASAMPPSSFPQKGVSYHDFGNGAPTTQNGHPVPPVVVDDSKVSVRSGRSRRSYQSTHSRRSEADLGPDHERRPGHKVNHTERAPRAPSPARSTRSNRSTRTDRSTKSVRSTKSRRAPSPARSTRSARSTKSTRSTRSTRRASSSAPSRAATRRTGPPSRAFSLGNLSRRFSRMTMGPRASRGRRVF